MNVVPTRWKASHTCNYSQHQDLSRLLLWEYWAYFCDQETGVTFLIVTTNRYSKLLKDISASGTTSTDTPIMFLDHWIVSYWIADFLMSDVGCQFDSKLVPKFCGCLRVKHITSMAFHFQKIGQIHRYSKTIGRLRSYLAEHENRWEIFVQPLMYARSTHVHWFIALPLFNLVLSVHRLGAK